MASEWAQRRRPTKFRELSDKLGELQDALVENFTRQANQIKKMADVGAFDGKAHQRIMDEVDRRWKEGLSK